MRRCGSSTWIIKSDLVQRFVRLFPSLFFRVPHSHPFFIVRLAFACGLLGLWG